MTTSLQPIIEKHPFLEGMKTELVTVLTGCARSHKYEAGEYLTHEGEAADHFYLLRGGRVALRIHHASAGGLTIQTVGTGDVVGWSWLIAPHRYRFDAQALEPVLVIDFDGKCLREKCQENPALGYELFKRVSEALMKRIDAMHLQLLDVYRSHDDR
jgi:CRP-like cAMP-binding protein